MKEIKEMTIEELENLKKEIVNELKNRVSMTPEKVIVELPSYDSRHKSWIKTIESVDRTKTNGYAFVGTFLKTGATVELPVGTTILTYYGEGSMKNYHVCADVAKVTSEGLEYIDISVDRHNSKATGWALDIRDALADYLEKEG